MSSLRRFGFDTEFVGENTYHPQLCLIQVSTAEALYLIDPLSVGPLTAFWELVVNPLNLVVVHAGREDVRLCRMCSGSAPGNLFDIQIAAGLVGYDYPLSHAKLVQQVLGVRIAKSETLTEWRNRPLSPDQIHYAFDDVRYLLPLWETLSTMLDERNRLSWAKEEFVRLQDLSFESGNLSAPLVEKWRKLRGLGSLDRRRLAVVRDLYRWREETAEQMNRPPRTVLRDDLLVGIARRNPKRIQDLAVIRGLPKNLRGDILDVVRCSDATPSNQFPEAIDKTQYPPEHGILVHLLTAVVGHLCRKNDMAPGLAVNQKDLKTLVRNFQCGQPMAVESLVTTGWRGAHILPELTGVLEGRRSIQVNNATESAPLRLADIPTVG